MVKFLGYWAAIVAVFFINAYFLGGSLNNFGLRPHEVSLPSLIGLFAHPFLHGNLEHLMSNTYAYLPLAFMSSALIEDGFQKLFWKVALFAGAITWFFSRKGVIEIGASGVIFGFLGFLIGAAIRELRAGNYREGFPEIAFASSAIAISGGMLPSMLPIVVPPGVSWQGHLAGFVVGMFLGLRGE